MTTPATASAGELPEPDVLVQEIAFGHVVNYEFNVGLNASEFGQRIADTEPVTKRHIVLAMIRWLRSSNHNYSPAYWRVRSALHELLRWKLPLTHDDLLLLVDWCIQDGTHWANIPSAIGAIKYYRQEHDLTAELKGKLRQLIDAMQENSGNADTRRWIVRLHALGQLGTPILPLVSGEAWADAAIADIESEPVEVRAAWQQLLMHCQSATGSKPSARWLNGAQPALARIGPERLKAMVVRWFALVDKPRTEPVRLGSRWVPDPNQLLQPSNADLLKGLAWRCARWGDRAVAQALAALAASAYRKIPQTGPRCPRLGNACAWALGEMPGLEGIAQLAVLKLKVKVSSAQKAIDKALAAAAQRAGLSPAELEEMSVPTYGLQEAEFRRETLGDYAAELQVASTTAVGLTWVRPDGKRQAAVPSTIKAEYGDTIKELKQAGKDIARMLPAQRDRLERLYLEPRTWRLAVWRERYLDHPLMGVLARRLIWKFTRADQAASGIWHAGPIVSRHDAPLDWLTDDTQVELWHPLQVSPETVLEWREWLSRHETQQPFKQAHREIYLLTDAERNTRVYSNRFAAHILRQHQFHALCAARGWRNRLRLMVDDSVPPATRLLPHWGLRAEYWVEGAGDNYGTDTNETGTFLYVATDQVRFYREGAPENWAHAMGGGYYADGQRGQASDPLPLEDIPPLVFSETMRDVDLFVGVASVGNDPTWGDHGPENRYITYWHDYSFGELSATAQTRKQILEGLIPRLKISDCCSLTDRFLMVRGQVRTYKIHLGSGNILMEPNDQYLCIVPAQGMAAAATGGTVFLPFEGDQTLAIILSKAFLLADDRSIKDPTILRQTGR